MIEKCASCGKIVVERDQRHNIVTAQPHTQCRTCKSIACEACVTVKACPTCGFKGKS